ncbi:hypothetical protein [Agrobacterium tumefaciens]|uniref:Uncharacterized protein n=1 Tax=Agrobacterium tumefaciens TaxID=358 RepID=A0A176WY75_AGRTU|nr:hypothetical protein [Agrobacterium tumefaciens]OAE37631.1 hypothetical protein A7J57_08620 [Agrobacterium tumefaciens]
MKKLLLPLIIIGALGAGVYVLKAVGQGDAATFLDAKAAAFTAEYHAAKAEIAAEKAADVVEQISPTTAE